MTLTTKLFLALIGIIIVMGGIIYWMYTDLADVRERAAVAEALSRQHALGLEQQLKQTKDSAQLLAEQVRSLNKDKNALYKKNAYYLAMTESLQLYIDSISVQGSGITVTGKDSAGNYTEVQFSGKELFIRYSGYTRQYGTFSKYRLDLYPDVIDITGERFRDVDGIWKTRIVSRTPGVKLTAFSVMDSSLFAQQIINSTPEAPSTLMLLFDLSASSTLDGILHFTPGVEAVAYERYYVRYQPLQKLITGGARFALTLW